jgi:hypothetical protein
MQGASASHWPAHSQNYVNDPNRSDLLAVTTFSYELSGIKAFALVILRREMIMPIGRFVAWVLALVFLAD